MQLISWFLTLAAATAMLAPAGAQAQAGTDVPADSAARAREPASVADFVSASDPDPVSGPAKLNAFTIHPILSLVISGLNVGYEGSLGGLNAFEIPLYLGYSERVYDNPMLFTGTGLGYRRYLLEPGTGAYVSPMMEFLNVHRFERGPDASSNLLVFAPSLRMGYKWRWNVFLMELGAGATFFTSNVTDGTWSDGEDHVTGLIPMGHFAVGIPF